MVIDDIACALCSHKLQSVGFHQPLVARLLISTIDTIIIIDIGAGPGRLTNFTTPMEAVKGRQLVLLRRLTAKDIQNQLFTKRGLVLQVKL